MKKSLIVCAALAAISLGAVAQPQPGSEHYNPEYDPQSPLYAPSKNVPDLRNQQQAPQRGYYDNRTRDNRAYDNRAYDNRAYDNRTYDNRRYDIRGNDQRYYAERERDQRHAYAREHYARGRYAPEWRGERYWVRDWRARQLSAPPRGYQWVQTDTGDLLLMAIASGLIANVILSQQY